VLARSLIFVIPADNLFLSINAGIPGFFFLVSDRSRFIVRVGGGAA
jgi:hypothetical protein